MFTFRVYGSHFRVYEIRDMSIHDDVVKTDHVSRVALISVNRLQFGFQAYEWFVAVLGFVVFVKNMYDSIHPQRLCMPKLELQEFVSAHLSEENDIYDDGHMLLIETKL